MAVLVFDAPEPSRPLAPLLEQVDLLDELIAANRDGRIDTRNWRTAETPAFHAGLHTFLSISHHSRGRLLAGGWGQEVVRNQERFISPEGMFDRKTKLALVGGQPDGDGFRVAHRGIETRLLIDCQGRLEASKQLVLAGTEQPRQFLDIVFVVSALIRSVKAGVKSELLRVYLAHPYDLSPDGSHLECDDVAEIAQIDLDGPGGTPVVLPAPVPVDPLLGFRAKLDQN